MIYKIVVNYLPLRVRSLLLFCLVLAIAVRFLTRRYIGEYESDMGKNSFLSDYETYLQ